MGHPPSSSGSFQLMVMELEVEVSFQGAANPEGVVQALKTCSAERVPSPLKLRAESLKRY